MTERVYDFDRVIDRKGTGSYKWDQSEQLFGRADILPLFVADMDFQAPKEVVEAVVERAKLGIYGYSVRPDSYSDAIIGWMARRHGWDVKREWLLSTPGVVPALGAAVLAFTEPGDGVILQSPVYYPFYQVIEANGRVVVDNPLVLEDGQYRIDFELLERQAADAKLLLLCSPHNPGGRVWTEEELTRIGDICVRHDVLIVADEIHHDLVLPPHQHTPLARISESFAQRTITCFAPSKTFNLAGLSAAGVIISDDGLRRKYAQVQRFGLSIHMDTYFGLTATETSYTYCEPWLEELLVYLKSNLALLSQLLAERLPEVNVIEPEGTYLAWLDCRAISNDPAELKKLMFEEAGVAFTEGSIFGKQGAGFLRVNMACPRSILQEGLERFVSAARRRLDGSGE